MFRFSGEASGAGSGWGGGPLLRITSRVSVFPEHLCPRMMPARCRLAQWGGRGGEGDL